MLRLRMIAPAPAPLLLRLLAAAVVVAKTTAVKVGVHGGYQRVSRFG